MEKFIVRILAAKDAFLNIFSLGAWGRAQGKKSSGVKKVVGGAGRWTRTLPGKRYSGKDFE